MDINKFLSHRLRGYGEYEHSPSSMLNACRSKAKYLEVDTRVSSDSSIYLYHNPKTGGDLSDCVRFYSTDSSIVNHLKFANGESLLCLEEALEIFSSEGDNQKLCLDIKDYGYEQEHLDLVRRYDLESSVCFVSWIPQSLIRLAELGTTAPLVLSHWNLLRFGTAGRLFSRLMGNCKIPLGSFVLLGSQSACTSLGNLAHGYQHGLFCSELPSLLEACLVKSKGGICVHKSMLSQRLIDYCRTVGLELWLFSVDSIESFVELSDIDGVDVVFCDGNAAKQIESNFMGQ